MISRTEKIWNTYENGKHKRCDTGDKYFTMIM
jgi:hypothetical protein